MNIGQQLEGRISLTIDEAAAAVGVGRTLIYEEISARRLKITKLGRRTLLRVEELQRWMRDAECATDSAR